MNQSKPTNESVSSRIGTCRCFSCGNGEIEAIERTEKVRNRKGELKEKVWCIFRCNHCGIETSPAVNWETAKSYLRDAIEYWDMVGSTK